MQLFQKRLSQDRMMISNKMKRYSTKNNFKNNNNLSPLRVREHAQVKQNKLHREKNSQYRPLSKPSQPSYNYHNLGLKHSQANPNKNISCNTHKQKDAQYCYIVDTESIFYCCICAAKLTSQGFILQRISHNENIMSRYNSDNSLIINAKQKFKVPQNIHQNQSHTLKNSKKKIERQQKIEPIYSNRLKIKCNKHSGNSHIKQLNILAQQIEQLLHRYSKLIENQSEYQNRFQATNRDYVHNKELVIKFYEKIIEIVLQYKQKHLKKLDQINQVVRSVDKIKSNASELSTINNDMLSTDFDLVIEKVSEDDFVSCLEFYKNTYSSCLDQYDWYSAKIQKIMQEPSAITHSLQSNIDKIEKIIKQFYDPLSLQHPHEKPVKNFIRLYEKGGRPKSHSKNPFQDMPDRNGHNFSQQY